jgi:hypothetical protein
MLANYAETRDGLLNVLGAGWSNYTVSSLPAAIVGQMILILDVEDVADRLSTVMTVELIDPGGCVVFRDRFRLEIEPTGEVVRIPAVVSFQAEVSQSGVYHARAIHGDREVAALPLEVRLVE